MTKSLFKNSDITSLGIAFLHLGIILAAIFATSFYSYTLFHSLAEVISVVIAMAIFFMAWNSRRFHDNSYYLLIGFGFLSVGVVDLLHAFTYKGLGVIFNQGDSNVATQLWLAGRYLIAFSFLCAPFFSGRKLKARTVFLFFSAITSLLLLSILYWKNFPTAYIDGSGLTSFKKTSEYLIIILFLTAFVFFYQKRALFAGRVFRLIALVLMLMALSEIAFTLYVGVYDFFNLLGHLLKLAAYYLAYLGIVEFGLMKPYGMLFKDLKDKETALRKATEEWSRTFDSISDLIFILDKNHTVIRANQTLCDFLGKKEEEIVGKKCYQFMHQEHQPWHNCPLKITKETKKAFTQEIDEPMLKKVLLVTTSPILDQNNEFQGFVHIAKDITERKEMERAKDEFLSLASHQLRTPLASISLASELLVRQDNQQLEPGQREMLGEIYQSTKQMAALISQMLNVSRIELGTLSIQPQPLDAARQIEEITNNLAASLQEKHLRLCKNIPQNLPPINFDKNIFHIIVENLLTNAIRYTPCAGAITISLEPQESQLLLTIADTGCGIPQKEQEQIFKKFFRAPNAKLISSDSHGLGLYMVKSVLDKIGTKIWFESEEKKGTTFFVALPRQ